MGNKVMSPVHLTVVNQLFSFFKNVDELNRNVASIFKHVHMNDTERKLIRFLAQKSLTYIGMSWHKVKHMASGIHKSVRMVGYALTSLEKKGVIKRHRVMRQKRGGNTSNIIVILPAASFLARDCRPHIADRVDEGTPEQPRVEQEKTTPESCLLESFKQDPSNIGVDENKLWILFQYKVKDKVVQFGSSYIEKVLQTMITEYEKRQYAKKQYEKRQQSKHIQNPGYDWLNAIDVNNFEERTSWLDL